MRDAEGDNAGSAYVLDTSALLALLEDEEGADEVEEILRNDRAVLPFPVLLEVYYITFQERGEKTADTRYAWMKALPVSRINEIDEPTLLTAGRFKATNAISVADAVIAAFAVRQNAILVHKDPEYELLADQVQQRILPYKARRTGKRG